MKPVQTEKGAYYEIVGSFDLQAHFPPKGNINI